MDVSECARATPIRRRTWAALAATATAAVGLAASPGRAPAAAGTDTPTRANRVAAPTAPGPAIAGPRGAAPTAPAVTSPAIGSVVEKRIAAVGDLACRPGDPTSSTSCRHKQVSDMLVADPLVDAFLALGDLQYDGGEPANFAAAYDPTYGRIKAKTIPVVGNHEYGTTGAAGYFGYFGAAAHPESDGYSSVELSPSWHLVVLNSNCTFIGGCDIASPQYQWLAADLAGSTKPCTIAVWHHPLFTSSARGGNTVMRPIWDLLTTNGVELVLNGHEHNYERFAPQRGDGTPDATAPRELLVGTGGRNAYPPTVLQPNSEVRQYGFGYLRLELRNRWYRFEFVPEPGTTVFTDAGAGTCV
jgi:hypothetical protein